MEVVIYYWAAYYVAFEIVFRRRHGNCYNNAIRNTDRNLLNSKRFEVTPMKSIKYILIVMAAGAALALTTQKASAADTVLVGNTLLVGVNNAGGVVQNSIGGPTPTSPFIGIQYDSTGTGNYSKGYDFITPGDPYQYYAVGVNGNYVANGYVSGNSLGMTTTDTSSGTTLQATSTGGSFGGLNINQTMSFQKSGAGSGIISFNVQLTNPSTDVTLTNVAYSTGLDPDQDVYFDSNYQTTNVITNPNFIYGTGTATAWTIAIKNTSDHASNDWIADTGWDMGTDTNPYITTYGTASGSFVGPGSNYADDTINMDWQLGDIGPGQTVNLTYEYVIAETPAAAGVPDGASTLGLLGLALAGLGAVRRKLMV
jgi:hypothetical protein